jgi:hypothetical protein
MDFFLDFLDMTEQEFLDSIEHMRDGKIWEQDENGDWYRTDSVANHADDPGVDEQRLEVTGDEHWTDITNPVSPDSTEDFITL